MGKEKKLLDKLEDVEEILLGLMIWEDKYDKEKVLDIVGLAYDVLRKTLDEHFDRKPVKVRNLK